ncbi:peptidoglycan DD-metalloendopeptidase family protein [Fulvivirga sediminis]|uniref:Peptidoglycan DD-metalloendopeptidase family protein n=1 Tax=Fulvivirga sediminis TaxID=2803949 RepID=A0A937F8T2_9BACT|nr:peptidoglycan DD-metalloendopeptidase family protein [Fulvivirga sediminis]MBL3657815.1 peptidoglycan DD-metalloendopeptidase family protein [Fulvivirga sediminis]
MKSFLLLSVVILLSSCNGIKSIKEAFSDKPPYQKYKESLTSAGLENTALAQKWIIAGQRALTDSIAIRLPFRETGYFTDTHPASRSFSFQANEGQILKIVCEATLEEQSYLFLDLFQYKGKEWKQVEHADSTMRMTYEIETTGRYLIRLQPPLLTKSYYDVQILIDPVLKNPVRGATNQSIGSFYGDPRDGGTRTHEGIDIFAARGTPVIAPTEGYITRVGSNRLGGNTIWLKDSKRGQSYYFAHLDKQLTQAGKKVMPGDTLGLVGNTGNAKSTPPHLHFGIYSQGSKDPIHYIKTISNTTVTFNTDYSAFSRYFITSPSYINLRSGPGSSYKVLCQLEKNTAVTPIGQHGDWLRIELPDHKQGYLFKKLISPIGAELEDLLLLSQPLYSSASNDAIPIMQLPDSTSAKVLGVFKNFSYIKTFNEQEGWISK